MRILFALIFASTIAWADAPDMGSNAPSQAAADAMRDYAAADGAFLAAGLVKTDFQKDKLETILQYPTDPLVVLNLTGVQIRQAFERSLSLYPQPNTSFLQISGFEVTFSKGAAPNKRVVKITAGGDKLQDGKTYRVAMPSLLGNGGLGYFKIWDKSNITKTYSDVTVESVLRGKSASEPSPRWLAQ